MVFIYIWVVLIRTVARAVAFSNSIFIHFRVGKIDALVGTSRRDVRWFMSADVTLHSDASTPQPRLRRPEGGRGYLDLTTLTVLTS